MSIENNFREEFFVKIEALFAAIRSRGLILSPLDYDYAKTWFDSGIPLSCVLRGIRDAVYHKLARNDGEEIRSLAYCRWAVNREFKEYKLGNQFHQPDVAARELSNEQIAALFQSFIFDLNRARQTALKSEMQDVVHILLDTIDLITDIKTAFDETFLDQEGIEYELQELDSVMMKDIYYNAHDELLGPIEAAVIRKMQDSRNNMPATEFENTKEKAIKARLRTALMLPVLTLYSL